MAQDHPPPDDSTTTTPASDVKARLDIEKLRLEISELRHWYKRPAFIQFIQSVLVFLITAIVALTGWWNGWFDVQRARLEVQRSEIRIDIEKLQAGKTDLNRQIVALTAERNGLSARVQTLSKDLDAVGAQARSFSERAAKSESARQGCVGEVQRWAGEYRRIATAASSLVPNHLDLPVRDVSVQTTPAGVPIRYTVRNVPDHSLTELLPYLQIRVPGLHTSTSPVAPLWGTVLFGEGAVDVHLEPAQSQNEPLKKALSDLGLTIAIVK